MLATVVQAASSPGRAWRSTGDSPTATASRAASWSLRYCANSCALDVLQHAHFLGVGLARGGQPECEADAAAGILAAFVQHALGQRARRLHVSRIVQQHQRLQRRVGHGAARRALLAVRRVEGNQRRRRHGALPERVHAAAVQIVAMALHISLRGVNRRRTPSPPTAPWADTGRRWGRRALVQQSAHATARCRAPSRRAGGSAGRAPAAGSPDPSPAVPASRARTAGRPRKSRSAAAWRLRPSRVRMNSVASQSSSSGCYGRLALRAEILGGLDDAGAEIHLPVAIHRHARGQRIARD